MIKSGTIKRLGFLFLLAGWSAVYGANTPAHLPAPTPKKPAALSDVSKIAGNYQKKNAKDGFLIVTSNDLTHRLKSLQAFISHKANDRDFNVFVITENDYDQYPQRIIEVQQRGASYGRVRGRQILYYLRNNYERLNLKYVLFIGDARCDTGDTPMLKIAHHKSKKNVYSGYKMSAEEYAQLTDEEKQKHDERMAKTNPKTGLPVESGHVVSDYPYVDLNTDWDANNDGFLDPAQDRKKGHNRRPEVYVGRVPYYGEESKYGKAEDVDIILRRFIRYDREENIAWRYNMMIEIGQFSMYEKIDFCEKHRINYQLFSRYKHKGIGMPSINSRKGGTNISNFEIIQDYGVGKYGNHSHGGPFGMEGLYSSHISKAAHDKWPTVLTLGACYVGMISKPENLVYTLLRFESVAVSGGTGGVTTFGGDMRGAEEAGIKDMIWRGASVGESRWETYGHMYRNFKGVPWMTACKINLYGDPSAVPFRSGYDLPYSFFADPIMGHFGNFDLRTQRTDEQAEVTLENNEDKPITISVLSTKRWLIPNQCSVTLRPGESKKVLFEVDNAKLVEDRPTDGGLYYRARMFFNDPANRYGTFRPFVLKRVDYKLQNYYNFDGTFGYEEDRATKSTSKAVLGAKEGNGLTEGIAGNGVSLADASPMLPLYVTDGEDVTLGFFLKASPVSKKQKVVSSNLINLRQESGGQLVLQVQDDRHTVNETYNLDPALTDEQWHHYLFSLEQKTGDGWFYIDGQPVKKFQFSPHSICGAPALFWGAQSGAIDEVLLYNQYRTAQQVQDIYNGYLVEATSPRQGQRYVSNKRLTCKAILGRNVQTSRLVLIDQTSKKSKTYSPHAAGEFMIPSLAEDTQYNWYVEGQTADQRWIRSQTNEFSTAKELIADGSFEESSKPWSGECSLEVDRSGKRVIHGNKSLKLNGMKSCSKRFPKALKGDAGYIFSAKALYGRAARIVQISAFAVKSNGKRELLASTSQVRNQHLQLQFRSRPNLSRADLLIEIKQTKAVKPRECWVLFDDLSLVQVPGSAVNLAPKLVPGAQLDQYEAAVGEDGYAIHLNELIEDPEGGALRFKKLGGPVWAEVQASDLFSAFGPTADAVGEEAEFLIQASDELGNATQFTLHVGVRKR